MRHYLLSRARRDLLKRIATDEHAEAKKPLPPEGNGIVAAFYATWQETGLHSLRANAAHITHLMPVWLALTGDGTGIDFRDWDPALTPHNLDVLSIAHDHHMQMWPVLSNAQLRHFDEDRAHKLLVSPAAQVKLAETLRDWLKDRKFQGVNVDFENLNDADNALVPAFLTRLHETLSPAGLGVSCDIQATDETLDWKALEQPCDFVVIEGYDEHAGVDSAGPISSMAWYRTVLDRAVKIIPEQKLVVGLGNYAYDWPEGKEAEPMTYLEALLRARDRRAGEPPDSVIDFDADRAQSHLQLRRRQRARSRSVDARWRHRRQSIEARARAGRQAATRCGCWARKIRPSGRCSAALRPRTRCPISMV